MRESCSGKHTSGSSKSRSGYLSRVELHCWSCPQAEQQRFTGTQQELSPKAKHPGLPLRLLPSSLRCSVFCIWSLPCIHLLKLTPTHPLVRPTLSSLWSALYFLIPVPTWGLFSNPRHEQTWNYSSKDWILKCKSPCGSGQARPEVNVSYALDQFWYYGKDSTR